MRLKGCVAVKKPLQRKRNGQQKKKIYMEYGEAEMDFNWDEYLEELGATAAPHTSFKHVELSLQSSFQPGMKLEVANKTCPDTYWVATIITTCGQLLLLRFCGYGDDRKADFWCDVMTAELHPVGWCTQNNKRLQPPEAIKEKHSDWTEFLIKELTGSRTAPTNLLEGPLRGKNTVDLIVSGCVLEIRDACEPCVYWAARVQRNVGGRLCLSYIGLDDPAHFIWIFYLDTRLRPLGWAKENQFPMEPPTGEMDDMTAEATPRSVVCHADSPAILPVQWCLKNGVGLEKPRGFQSQDFDWADYLKYSGTEAAPEACFLNASVSRGFCKDTWLEAVNPLQPAEFCVARITQVKGQLLWLRFEGLSKPLADCIVDVESMDIFPVGWCEANSYPLTAIRKAVCSVNGKYCCSQIFINHRCFSGPYLNKGRIAELPQTVGPGKCTLVLKEVLTMLINSAYKPARVLRELQLVEDPKWNCLEETLKAKYKGKSYRSSVRIVRLAEQVSDFCRTVCVRLQCCPNLFGPTLVSDNCPENCSIYTKTKYTYYYGKRRKVGRPSLAESTQDGDTAKSSRRRKKRKTIFVQKKRRSSVVGYNNTESPQPDHTEEEEARLVLERNPLEWSVSDVVDFIMSTDCASLAKIFQEQDIDGQALLLLTLPTVQECMDLKLGPAIKLCHQIERVKVAFYSQYAN
uniref:SAM domain-containing protein n=1 Tax=Pygocentrus nattereri TaxID=42514 RepID=A0AAR2JH05_PYGNA